MERARLALDVVAGSVTLGSLLQLLPPLAAIVSIIWVSLQIHDRIKYGPRNRRESWRHKR